MVSRGTSSISRSAPPFLHSEDSARLLNKHKYFRVDAQAHDDKVQSGKQLWPLTVAPPPLVQVSRGPQGMWSEAATMTAAHVCFLSSPTACRALGQSFPCTQSPTFTPVSKVI